MIQFQYRVWTLYVYIHFNYANYGFFFYISELFGDYLGE